MEIISGVYTSAKIFTDTMEEYARAQIQMICDNKVAEGSTIRVMPDVHPGKVGTIGLTMTVGTCIMPNLTGIDIGCGITLARLNKKKAEFQKLDKVIRENIPSGFSIRRTQHRFSEQFDIGKLRCAGHVNWEKTLCSLGTLGGGNHFIELDQDAEGVLYAAIHSGSRHLGKEVTEYYLREGQKELKERGENVPYELTYLIGKLMEDYLHDQSVVREFASLNREAILDELVKGMKWKVDEYICCSHNYIEEPEPSENTHGAWILRKGAVSARKGESVIIPINMRDGVILGIGLGNAEWNYSAPHGSGRILKRGDVKSRYTVSHFKSEMKGIYSSCIGKETLDEAPFAYRALAEIKSAIRETVEIQQILKPVYNFKAGNER